MTEDDSLYREAELRLNEWGGACRDTMQHLGLPTISNLAETLAHVQRQDREEKSDHRRRLRAERERRRRENLPPLDARQVAEMLGFAERERTAKGKSTRLGRIPTQVLESRVLEMDRIVSSLPKWAQKCLFRAYMYRQGDKLAARDLRMPRIEYVLRRQAAVEMVAEKIDRRYIRRTYREV